MSAHARTHARTHVCTHYIGDVSALLLCTQEGISPEEMSCLTNCAAKVNAFQLQAATVMMDDLQKKKQEQMKAMQQQQFAQQRMM